MIKTMLLTAQLALSPIVGTNGLQPKRLANPVYGETTDYSVSYQGETYTRYGYNDMKQYALNINFGDDTPYIGFTEFNKDVWVSDSLAWTSSSNILQITTEYYMTLNMEDPPSMPKKTCFSWWLENDDGNANYLEAFFNENFGYTFRLWEWEYDGTFSNYSEGTGAQSQNAYPSIDSGENIYFYQYREITDWGNHQRAIPQEQPNTANPSVYDNIYNFYYQNLFANEALDELGAEVGNNSLTMRQWLAHTATIVSISLLACALVVLVIKIFKLIAGSISDIWG